MLSIFSEIIITKKGLGSSEAQKEHKKIIQKVKGSGVHHISDLSLTFSI